ncbi:YadA C-terminal domain-containing protein [Pasteurella dagmatis]|uniref:YadA-like domain protein n=1 Tax=Pasteurella dagmatis ATCC 43325 TaxID=667128 RepID=C9PS68_9PAST|nr:YadA C-terminal domain-containing protein [Pasteurella dagmatis]EEX49795.1 YadA-like domain protein [Pasteurella dagmatis ATCC 43325]SNV71451.1 Adhesin yadA precursor [Pasteurella dagmatis]
MNKLTSMTKLSICIALSVASYSASASTSTSTSQPAPAPENLAQNVSNLVYHSAQLPIVVYKHKDIIGKLVRGEVVNPSNGLLGTLLSGTASLFNGDLGKLVKLSSDLGSHFKGIQENISAIKSSAEKSLPNAVVNLISNTPGQIYTTVNNTLDYVADATVERSKIYQKEKNKLIENNKELSDKVIFLEKIAKEIAIKNKKLEQDSEALKTKNTEVEELRKEIEKTKELLANIKQTQESTEVVKAESTENNKEKERAAVEPKSAEKEKVERNTATDIQNENIVNSLQKEIQVSPLAAQYMVQSEQQLKEVRNDVAKLQHKYHQLQNTIQENRNLSSRGIASIAAMANIPVPAVAGKTTIGAGVGHFDSKNAIAVGLSSYYQNGTAVKVSLGTAGSNVAFGGGISYSF